MGRTTLIGAATNWEQRAGNIATILSEEFSRGATKERIEELLVEMLKLNLVTRSEAAAELRTTPDALKMQTWRGKVPCVKLGGEILYDLIDLREMVQQRKVYPKKESGRKRGKNDLYVIGNEEDQKSIQTKGGIVK